MNTPVPTTNMGLSPFGTYRPITIILLLCTFFTFSLAVIFDWAWEIGWCCIAIALLSEVLQSMYDLNRRFFMFDGLLFSASNLLFIVADPVFAILVGHDFPRVFDTFYSGNSVGNLSGLLVTTYCLCFFGGRLFIRSNKTRMRTDKRLLPLPNAIKPHVIVIAVSIAFTAYLANGGGFSVENLLKTIVARSSGYVAFASAGFGTQNPVIVLLAHCIPATIILLLLSFRRGAYFANFFTVLVVLLLFGLFALSGSRSGVILVTVAVGIFVFSHRNIKLRPLRFFFATALMLIVLSFQTNFRDSGQIRNDFFQHSPFRGFSLNREVAFIVETYPEQLEFYRQGLLHRMVLPIPETIMLFVTNPVPRIFWPNKPVDASFSSFNELRTGATGFAATSNVTPTIPGRFYMLYGWFGVVQIGFVLGLSWRFVDNLLTRARIRGDADMMLVMSTLNAILFISCRDLTPGKFFPVLFLLLFIYVGRLTVRRA